MQPRLVLNSRASCLASHIRDSWCVSPHLAHFLYFFGSE